MPDTNTTLPLSQASRRSEITTTLPGRNGTATTLTVIVSVSDQRSSSVFRISQVVKGYTQNQKKVLSRIRSQIDEQIALQRFSEALAQVGFYANLLNNSTLDGTDDRYFLLGYLKQIYQKMPITNSALTVLLQAFGLISAVPIEFSAQSIDLGFELIEDIVGSILDGHSQKLRNPEGRTIFLGQFDESLYTEALNVIGDLLVCVNNADWDTAPPKIFSLKNLLRSLLFPISQEVTLGDVRREFWSDNAAFGIQLAKSTEMLNPPNGSNWQTLNPPQTLNDLPSVSVLVQDDAQLQPYTTSDGSETTIFPTYVFSVIIWYSANPYPWATRVDSTTVEFLLFTQDWVELEIAKVSQLLVSLQHPDGWKVPSSEYKETCSLWNNQTIKWEASKCVKKSQTLCSCGRGSEFGIQTEYSGGQGSDGKTGDWWADPGMWIAIVVAIICAFFAILLMYFLAWLLKHKLSKLDKDEYY